MHCLHSINSLNSPGIPISSVCHHTALYIQAIYRRQESCTTTEFRPCHPPNVVPRAFSSRSERVREPMCDAVHAPKTVNQIWWEANVVKTQTRIQSLLQKSPMFEAKARGRKVSYPEGRRLSFRIVPVSRVTRVNVARYVKTSMLQNRDHNFFGCDDGSGVVSTPSMADPSGRFPKLPPSVVVGVLSLSFGYGSRSL
jgi:hypothetical protein